MCDPLIILGGYSNDRDEAYLSGSGNTKNDIETYENTNEKWKIYRWKIIDVKIEAQRNAQFCKIIDDHYANVLLLHDASLNKLETREVLGKYEFRTATIRMTVSLPPPHTPVSANSQPIRDVWGFSSKQVSPETAKLEN